MTKRGEVYKCNICGNIVEVLHTGVGTLVCCGQPMQLMKANSDDSASKEKHVPIIAKNNVLIGATPHPMETKHYIEWIEATSEGKKQTAKVFLTPKNKPEANFPFKVKSARAYCNLHGLWKSK